MVMSCYCEPCGLVGSCDLVTGLLNETPCEGVCVLVGSQHLGHFCLDLLTILFGCSDLMSISEYPTEARYKDIDVSNHGNTPATTL